MGRLRVNGLKTTLGAALTASATSISFTASLTHSAGTPLATIAAGDYLPLSLLDVNGNLSEIVWLTAYTSGATTGTISRGQEGTVGVSHASGDKAIHGPSALDLSVPNGLTLGDAAWTTVTFQNSWVDYGAPFAGASYRKDALGQVHLRGVIKSGTLGQAAFTLPAGSRPGSNFEVPSDNSAGATNPMGVVAIGTDGTVKPTNGGNGYVYLEGITFLEANATGQITPGGGGAALLALQSYEPSGGATVTANSTTVTDVDATNLAVTFTAPPSGKVLVRLGAWLAESAPGDVVSQWGIREGTTTVALSGMFYMGQNSYAVNQRATATFVVIGLVPGSMHTYKFAHAKSAGVGSFNTQMGGGNGPAIMEVYDAAPSGGSSSPIATAPLDVSRATLASDFTTATNSAWVNVPGLTKIYTPAADGYMLAVPRFRVSASSTADMYARTSINPAPASGPTYSAVVVQEGATAARWYTTTPTAVWEVKSGVTYTLGVDVYASAGTLTVQADASYHAAAFLFLPKSPGGGGSGLPGLLAVSENKVNTSYALPGSTPTDADIDSTNLAVTFTVPSSGQALVRASALIDTRSGITVNLTLRNGTTTLAENTIGTGVYGRQTAVFRLSGLTPGQTLTYKLGWHTLGTVTGTVTLYNGGNSGTFGNAFMEVYDPTPSSVARPSTYAVKRTSGDIAVASSSTYIAVNTALDLVVPAKVGDVIDLGLSIRVTTGGSTYAVFDFQTIVGGNPVNSVTSDGAPSTAASHPSWGSPATSLSAWVFSGRKRYTVVAGDISGGNVTFRLMCRNGGAVTVVGGGDPYALVNAQNLSGQ